MEKKKLSLENQLKLEEYCGNKQCILMGWVTEIKKNKFYAIFKRNNLEDVQLEHKKKKLNLKQKAKLIEGRIIKLDFNDGKLYFKEGENNWI